MSLSTKRAELAAKQKQLHDIFVEAGEDLDLSKVKSIEGDNSHKRDEIKRRNDELNAIGAEVEMLLAQENTSAVGRKLNAPVTSAPVPGGEFQGKSLGEIFTDSVAYKNRPSSGPGPAAEIDMDVKDIVATLGLKTVLSTSAGWAPQAIRTGIVIPNAQRPVQVLDLLPSGQTTQAAVVFMEETTFTSNAAETSEAATYGESALAFTERTSNVRKIATFIPVTDEQLDDVPQVQGYVNNRLVFMLRQRLDAQVLTGNGTPPNLTGILSASNLQSQAKGADPGPDALYKALIKVRITGRAMPSAYVIHPTDWQNLRLLRTAEGVYIYGNPNASDMDSLWGLPVAISDALSAGTAIVGDFQNFCELDFRRNIEVQVGYVNDDFSKGKKSIRADLRAAFVVYRGAAFCQVTGL